MPATVLLTVAIRCDHDRGVITANVVDESENPVLYLGEINLAVASKHQEFFDGWKEVMKSTSAAITRNIMNKLEMKGTLLPPIELKPHEDN